MISRRFTSFLVALLPFASTFADPTPASPTPSATPQLATPEEAAAALPISLPKIGQIKPRSAAEISGSDWSIGCETIDREYTDYNKYKSYLGPLGAKAARFQAGWARTEKQPGVYDFTWLDPIIDDCVSQHVQPWLQLSYGNRIYKGGGHENIFTATPKGEAAIAWDNWVTAVIRRYKDRVRVWEIWNEADISGSTTLQDYVDLYIRTAEIIRKEDPEGRIYALSMSKRTDFAAGFIEEVSKQGKLHLIDEITFHHYPQNPDDLSVLNKLRQILKKYPDQKIALRQGETGAPSGETSGALDEYQWSELSQVKWNLRRMFAHHAEGIPVNLFTISDFAYPKKGRNAKGQLLVNPDKSVDRPKVSYYAAQAVFSIFDDSVDRAPDLSVHATPSEKTSIRGYRKKASGLPMVVAWQAAVPVLETNTTAPVDFKIPGNLPNPVYVDLRTGSVYGIPASQVTREGGDILLRGIPVYDSPILIADQSCLPL